MTLPTITTLSVVVSVGFIVWMALRATCSQNAVYPTLSIFLRRNWFQMRGTNARCNSAQMVKLHFFWNRPDKRLEGKAMGHLAFKFPVVFVVSVTNPKPTRPEIGTKHRDGASLVDPGPESILGWTTKAVWQQIHRWITVHPPTLVVNGTPTPTVMGSLATIDGTGRLGKHLGLILRGVRGRALQRCGPSILPAGAD